MKSYLIGYDLHKPRKEYDDLIEAIENKFVDWCHLLDSTWIVKTDADAAAILAKLTPHIDQDDSLFVVLLQREASWHGLPQEAEDWLQRTL